MQFRTPINITPCGFRIGYAQRGLLLGSCFAENIGMRMKRYKLPVVFNPFGILFNPASVARTLTRLDSGKLYEANDLTRSGDLWVSFDHHGSLASVDRDEALKTINQAVQSGARALREAGHEYGVTTGRPRRVGWFDAVATRYGCMAQGTTDVALTLVDVLSYLEKIPVVTGYELKAK